jgi:hypothetical protein
MQACTLDAYIPANHRLEITLPASFPVGKRRIEVSVVEDRPAEPNAVAALLAWQKTLPRRERSAEEIEAQIREERESWGDA